MAVVDDALAGVGTCVALAFEAVARAGSELAAGAAAVADADAVVAAAGPVCDSGLGASTPAVLEPRPSFCKLGASSLPLAFMPLSD